MAKKKANNEKARGATAAISVDQMRDAFFVLHESLSDAYWAAGTMEDKDRIRGVSDLIFDILTALNRADIASRTKEFEQLKTTIDASTTRLEELKDEIDKMIKAIKVATQVVKAIEQVLKTAAKFLVA